jgi:hypothetical protein
MNGEEGVLLSSWGVGRGRAGGTGAGSGASGREFLYFPIYLG